MEEPRKGKGGRPKTGPARPHKIFSYLDAHELHLLDALAKKRGEVRAQVIRQGIRHLAQAEGLE